MPASLLIHSKRLSQSHQEGFRYYQVPSPRINNTTATSASTPTIIEEYGIDYDQKPAPNLSTTTPATPSPTSSPTILPTTTTTDNTIADDMVE